MQAQPTAGCGCAPVLGSACVMSEKQRRRWERELAQREARELDEIATQAYARQMRGVA